MAEKENNIGNTYHIEPIISRNASINVQAKRKHVNSHIFSKKHITSRRNHGLYKKNINKAIYDNSKNGYLGIIADELARHQDNVIDSKDFNENWEDEEIRKNVWSDVDDELYIANVIKLRTSNEHKQHKRDTSANIGDSDYKAKVVSSVKLDKYREMWDLESADLTECDCLGPPPEFLLPPPPRPPLLQAEYYCGEDPIPDLETCDTEPVSIFLHYD